ncbi:unnamed protein product [Parajaminaea phylloscopi]
MTVSPSVNVASKSVRQVKTRKGCWATLMTGDGYLPGLAVFAHSLLRSPHASAYPLVVLVARNSCSPEAVEVVRQLGCQVVDVDRLDPPKRQPAVSDPLAGPAAEAAVAAVQLAWARFSEVWTKLRVFELDKEGYERVVLVDSDMLVLRNMDELMEDVELPVSQAGPDAGTVGIAASFACTCNPAKIASYPLDWIPQNCAFTAQSYPSSLSTPPMTLDANSPPTYHLLNSGLVVLSPSSALFKDRMLPALATDPRVPNYRFPDQDFLADFFHLNVLPLPYIYNALKKLRASHTNIWRDEDVKNLHYIHAKPWENKQGGGRDLGGPDEITHSWWWNAWLNDVQPCRAGGVDANLWRDRVERFVSANHGTEAAKQVVEPVASVKGSAVPAAMPAALAASQV